MAKILSHLRSIVTHDGAVILNVPQDEIVDLNSTGAYVWAKLQEGKCVDEIIRDLQLETGIDTTVVEREVIAFVDKLTGRRLLAI